ncbi:MAG: hypothetical protein KGJ64_03855, partial [Betaproteobacteria bacterium]|nr:hypothetical protein [Betaproteobacteria bacterium]
MNLPFRFAPLLAALGAAAVLGGCASGVSLNSKAPVETQTATPVGAAGNDAATAGGVAGQGGGQSSVASVQTGGAGAQGGGPNSGPTADV